MNSYTSQKLKVVSFALMIMVVFIHSYNINIKQNGVVLFFEKDFNWLVQNFISNGLTRIAVPLFFLISGYLLVLDQKIQVIDFVVKIKKRVKTLVLPYFIWALLGVLLFYVLQSVPQSKPFFTKQLIKDYSVWQWVEAIFVQPIPYQLWFLRDLIVMVFLAPILFFVVKKLKFLFLLPVFGFWLFNQDTVFLSSEGLLFFSVGMYISTFKKELIDFKFKKASLLLLLWIVLLTIKTFIGFSNPNQLAEMLLLKASILAGIVAFWSVYDRCNIKIAAFGEKLVGFSFFLYLFHEPFLTIVNKFLFSQLPKVPTSYFLVYLVAPTFTIVVSIFTGWFLKSYVSRVYQLLTGNR